MMNRSDVIRTVAFIIFFVILMFLTSNASSCRKHRSTDTVQDSSTKTSLEIVREKGEFYVAIIPTVDIGDIFPDRCDNLTFMSHANGTGYLNLNTTPMEANGQWFRDAEPCFPNASQSSISFDGLLGVLHQAVAEHNVDLVNRLIAFGEKTGWVMGIGRPDLVTLPHLAPIAYMVRDYLEGNDSKMFFNKDTPTQICRDILAGFRGHLLASYLWLRLRTVGYLYDVELAAAMELVNASPANPMYQAIFHRALDGDQTQALILLEDTSVYPNAEGEFPAKTGVHGWGGEPLIVDYLIALAIIEGR